MKEYHILKALRRGETIDLSGIFLKMDGGEIKTGDIYVAEGNTGPKLLTAKEVVMTDDGHAINFIFPTCDAYPYDGCECVKVREA